MWEWTSRLPRNNYSNRPSNKPSNKPSSRLEVVAEETITGIVVTTGIKVTITVVAAGAVAAICRSSSPVSGQASRADAVAAEVGVEAAAAEEA